MHATDGKGNKGKSGVQGLVDNTLPTVTFTAPAANAVVNGTFGFEVALADAGSGVASVTVRIEGEAPTQDPSQVFAPPRTSTSVSGSENTIGRSDGPITLRARATDAAGNEAETSIVVVVDNTCPDRRLVTPSQGQRVSGTITLHARSDAPDLASIQILVDAYKIVTGSSLQRIPDSGPYGTAFTPRSPWSEG